MTECPSNCQHESLNAIFECEYCAKILDEMEQQTDEDNGFIICISCGDGIDDGTPFTRYCDPCQTIEDNKTKEAN